MKRHKILCMIASLVALGPAYGQAGDIMVIVNVSVKAVGITPAELRSVFLAEKHKLADGWRVEPVLARGGPAHEILLQRYLGKTDDSLQTYYRTLVFTGTGAMPKTLGSDAEILSYVARTRDAIGYISSDSASNGVNVLTILEAGSGGQRKLLTRVEPEYPDTLRRLMIGGTVRLKVTVGPKGSVEEVELVGGNPILAECALKAVRQWIYAASPVTTTTEVSIPFVAGK